MREACLLLALTGVSFVGIETELSVGSMTGQQIFIIYGKNVVPNGSGTDSVRQRLEIPPESNVVDIEFSEQDTG